MDNKIIFPDNKTRLSNPTAHFEDLNLFLALQSRPREAGGKLTELSTNWFINAFAELHHPVTMTSSVSYSPGELPAKSHQRACKTIMCHLATRLYSRKAFKHTAIPLVTPGAVSPSLPCAHVGVCATGCQCLLCYSSGLVITLISEGGGGGDTLMQGSRTLCALSSRPPTTPWGPHMVCGPAQSIPPPPLMNTCTHTEVCLGWG